MREHLILPFVLVLLLSSAMIAGCRGAKQPTIPGEGPAQVSPQPSRVLFQDSFDNGALNPALWNVTSEGDFAEMAAEVIDSGSTNAPDFRLRLMANTLGTADDTVKFLGVRTLQNFELMQGIMVSFELDWNEQANGSYLTSGLYLSPVLTDFNPAKESDWIALEYIGVPPGKNARFQIARNVNGRFGIVYDEGWPNIQRTGRKIAKQHIEVFIDAQHLKVIENSKELFSSSVHGLNFNHAYIYFQMSSHSNYPGRTVYYDNILVQGVSPVTTESTK